MIRLVGLFVVVVVAVTWVLFASSILDGIGDGGRAAVLDTVAPTRAPETPAATRTPPPGRTATASATATAEATPAPTPTLAIGPGGERTYTIEPGDNLTRIANRFGVTIDALQEANGITDPSSIKVGQVIVIPPAP